MPTTIEWAEGRAEWDESKHPRRPDGKFGHGVTALDGDGKSFSAGSMVTSPWSSDVYQVKSIEGEGLIKSVVLTDPKTGQETDLGTGTGKVMSAWLSVVDGGAEPAPKDKPTARPVDPLRGNAAFDSVPNPKKFASTESRAAIVDYQSWQHGNMNGALRHGTRPDGVSPEENQARIDRMKAAFDAAPALTKPIVTHRGTGNADAFLGAPGSRTGQTFVEPGFSSTTADSDVMDERFSGGGVTFNIRVPAGAKAIQGVVREVEGLDEKEIILPPDTKYRVISDEVWPDPDGREWMDQRKVELEVVI